MDEPLVCCILPYHTPDYYEQAIECFHNQTYQKRILFSLNTSGWKLPVGTIRNLMIEDAPSGSVIAHLDHDDWSCPTRLAEQVAFLQSTGACIVGYRDMPFYDVRTQQVTFYKQPRQNYALGTSLMYWRSVWEQHPFIETLGDEDAKFEQAVGFDKVQTQSSITICGNFKPSDTTGYPWPRMVARIHPGNTSPKCGARYEKATQELTAAVLACIRAPINVR